MDHEIKIWEDTHFPNFDDNMVIHFEIPVWNQKEEIKVCCDIFWKKNKKDRYKPIEMLISKPCAILYTFQNGIIVKGTLEIKIFKDFNSKDTLGIFADFYYYKKGKTNYIWHTEGFLISFNPQVLDVEPIDIIEVIDNPSGQLNPMVTSDAYNDLFPYIYLSGWPKTAASELLWNFVYYKPFATSPPVFLFPNRLASLKLENNRSGMQKEAIYFIEGKPPYELQYVIKVNALQGYIGNFKSFYHFLKKEKILTTIVKQTCFFFKTDEANFSNYLTSEDYLENKERLWESYFALVIEMGYNSENLTALIEVLILCNFLENVFKNIESLIDITTLSNEILLSLFNATIVLDSDIFPLPPYASSPPVSAVNGVFPYAIGDLQLVKYKLLRYEVGEIASITSVMPGEKRKLINRKLDRVVETEVSKINSEKESLTKSCENNSDFSEELWNTIAETTETTNYPDPGLVSTYGPPTNITIKGSYTKIQTTQTPDKKQLSSFAKKILNTTTQRLTEKVNKVRAHTQLKELEDISVSVINNSNNKESIYGIYCWLNKIYQTKVINYGKRMLFSFIIPNPAGDYIEERKILNGSDLQEPKSLNDFKIETYQDITIDNYLKVAQYYQLKKFPLYPQEIIVVSDVVALSQSKLIALPNLYYADAASIEYAFGSGQTNSVVSGFLGQKTFTFNQANAITGTKELNSLNNEQGSIAVSTVYDSGIQMSPPDTETDFQMGVTISCAPLPQTILTWQIEMYQLLYEAYIEKEKIYNLEIGSLNIPKETVNPLSERLIIKLALEKGIRKELLQNALQVKGISVDGINTIGTPNINFNQPEITQYLNFALEWNEMSYTFLDKYDNDSRLFSVASLSPDFFSAFLKAAYARVIIPISPDFNNGFLYFLNTGIVWNSKDSLAPCFKDTTTDEEINSDQLSIVYQLKKDFNKTEHLPDTVDSWEVLIPTPMQILQNKNSLKIKSYE
jgi:hypothetical protein